MTYHMENVCVCVQKLLQAVTVCTEKASRLLNGSKHPRVQDYSYMYCRYGNLRFLQLDSSIKTRLIEFTLHGFALENAKS